jgi:hypothetical protein
MEKQLGIKGLLRDRRSDRTVIASKPPLRVAGANGSGDAPGFDSIGPESTLGV